MLKFMAKVLCGIVLAYLFMICLAISPLLVLGIIIGLLMTDKFN